MRAFHAIALTGTVSAAFVAGAALFRAGSAEAQQAPSNYGGGTVDSNNRFIAATGSVGSGMSVLWLVDTQGKRVLVYGTNNLGKSIELRAARNIEWDLGLDEYMDDSQYKPEDLKRMADRQRGPVATPKDRPSSGEEGK
jgi:hypothetical protein